MAWFDEYGQGVYCIDSGYIQDQFCAIYLLRDGDEVAIIDTGANSSIDRVLSVLTDLGIDNQQIKYVIPTHVHLDHVGGASAMMKLFPQARLIIHPRGERHMIDPSRLISGSIAVYGEALYRRLYGEIEPIDSERIDVANDLDSFDLGGRSLLFIDTPGHARHHFCIYDEISKGIFSGDTFGISYPSMKTLTHGLMPTSSPVQFDAEALYQSIDRLMEYRPNYFFVTHFGRVDRPESKVASLKQWIGDMVNVCRAVNPVDSDSTKRLEIKLRELATEKLDNDDPEKLEQVINLISADLRLNAQGLAIWWQSGDHA